MSLRSNLAEIPAAVAVFGGPCLLLYVLFQGFAP